MSEISIEYDPDEDTLRVRSDLEVRTEPIPALVDSAKFLMALGSAGLGTLNRLMEREDILKVRRAEPAEPEEAKEEAEEEAESEASEESESE